MVPPLASRARALALDFGRVLTLDPDRSSFETLLAEAGLDPRQFAGAYAAHRHEYDRGTLHAGDYWRLVLGAAGPGLSAEAGAALLPRLIDADFASWAQPRTDLHHILSRALDAGVPMAIVSNMPAGVGGRFVDSWPWLSRIRHRFFSGEFGLVKPDEDFYRHVLEETGWEAGDVLFVDDLPANIEAAARLGFRTLLFTGSPADLEAVARWCGVSP